MNGPNAIEPAQLIFVLVFYGVIALVALGISFLISYLLYNSAKSLPQNYQQVSPGQAFLLMIPLFSLVWLFIYLPQLSKSFQEFFRQNNQHSDDCGEQLGFWWAILSACTVIPCIGIIPGMVALIIMILYQVKVNECKNRVLSIVSQQGGPRYYASRPPGDFKNPYDPNN